MDGHVIDTIGLVHPGRCEWSGCRCKGSVPEKNGYTFLIEGYYPYLKTTNEYTSFIEIFKENTKENQLYFKIKITSD